MPTIVKISVLSLSSSLFLRVRYNFYNVSFKRLRLAKTSASVSKFTRFSHGVCHFIVSTSTLSGIFDEKVGPVSEYLCLNGGLQNTI